MKMEVNMISPLYMQYQGAACRLWQRAEKMAPEKSDREINTALAMQRTAEFLLECAYSLAMRK